MSSDNKKNQKPPAENEKDNLYEEAQRSMIEKEWDEIFKNLKVDEEEYKIFLSFGTKMDDGRPTGPFRPIMPSPKK